MKNNFLLAVITVVFLSACSKSATDDNGGSGNVTVIATSSVPAAVMTTFNTNFPGSTEVEWQHNSSNSFTSQFNHNSQRHDAGFDDNGHQSSHSVICLSAPVPQVVLSAFRQNFPTDNVYEWKLTNAGEWKAHFMRGTVKWEATFSASGVLIKLEKA